MHSRLRNIAMCEGVAIVLLVSCTGTNSHSDAQADGLGHLGAEPVEVGVSPEGGPIVEGPLKFVSVVSGGGFCPNAKCTYKTEVMDGALVYTSLAGQVTSFQLEGDEYAKVRQLAEAAEFERAVVTYTADLCHDPPGGGSELHVAWGDGAEYVLKSGGGCPQDSPIGLVSQRLWELKLKYTGDAL